MITKQEFLKLIIIQKVNYLLLEWIKIGFYIYGVFTFVGKFF